MKYIAIPLLFAGLVLVLSSLTGNAEGFGYPLGENVSYHPDWNKGPNIPKIGGYDWYTSPACGIDLCGDKNVVPIVSGETYIGLHIYTLEQTGLAKSIVPLEPFNGHYYIKG